MDADRATPGHARTLTLSNCQSARRLNLPPLRRIIHTLLEEVHPGGAFDLTVNLVADADMIRLNETFLHHEGSTDVITFNYSESAQPRARVRATHPQSSRPGRRRHRPPALLHGEIFICLDEAASQARRYRTPWQEELVRYVVHGVLHLLGYDDLRPADRRKMKSVEVRLLRELAGRFDFQQLSRRR